MNSACASEIRPRSDSPSSRDARTYGHTDRQTDRQTDRHLSFIYIDYEEKAISRHCCLTQDKLEEYVSITVAEVRQTRTILVNDSYANQVLARCMCFIIYQTEHVYGRKTMTDALKAIVITCSEQRVATYLLTVLPEVD